MAKTSPIESNPRIYNAQTHPTYHTYRRQTVGHAYGGDNASLLYRVSWTIDRQNITYRLNTEARRLLRCFVDGGHTTRRLRVQTDARNHCSYEMYNLYRRNAKQDVLEKPCCSFAFSLAMSEDRTRPEKIKSRPAFTINGADFTNRGIIIK